MIERPVGCRLRGSVENRARSTVNQSRPAIRPAPIWASSLSASPSNGSADVTRATLKPEADASSRTRSRVSITTFNVQGAPLLRRLRRKQDRATWSAIDTGDLQREEEQGI